MCSHHAQESGYRTSENLVSPSTCNSTTTNPLCHTFPESTKRIAIKLAKGFHELSSSCSSIRACWPEDSTIKAPCSAGLTLRLMKSMNRPREFWKGGAGGASGSAPKRPKSKLLNGHLLTYPIRLESTDNELLSFLRLYLKQHLQTPSKPSASSTSSTKATQSTARPHGHLKRPSLPVLILSFSYGLERIGGTTGPCHTTQQGRRRIQSQTRALGKPTPPFARWFTRGESGSAAASIPAPGDL
ncbi:hypothetical protein PtA15_10A307 [Puccinia triticina]|uniref:Uncharacterized protein n=1 Tax=Puccinia triticina TaxID=208348 RepID=A0ABY7CXN8_9BASI|nr:uncharacterized protein PtA15_10A307 [Puccinia triticina]WAQ88886.1 hypothetical protein PtA15_10A307 [Puccinia triticina]